MRPDVLLPSDLLRGLPVEVIETYESQIVVYSPIEALSSLRDAAADHQIRVSERDAYDVVETPAESIDTRTATLRPREGLPFASYEASEYGLYLLQLNAPLKAGWLEAIERIGAIPVQPLPQVSYLIAATPSGAKEIAALEFAQWVEPFHPFLKAAPPDEGKADVDVLVDVEFAPIPGAIAARERVRELFAPRSDEGVGEGPEIRARGRLNPGTIKQVLREATVIGVHRISPIELSDERQSLGLSRDNIQTDTGGNDVPVPGTSYTTWLYNSARCSVCSTLAADGFKVGIADSGYYDGVTTSAHANLPNARVTYGGNFVPTNDTRLYSYQGNDTTRSCVGTIPCDLSYHGTFVAGLIAGAGSSGSGQDSGGFYFGGGIAPSARIVATKIVSAGKDIYLTSTTSTPVLWAQDALSNGAFIQNHSHNKTLASGESGFYTSYCASFDKVVRGVAANGTAFSQGRLTIVTSAGNNSASYVTVQPAGTAKNVITIGAAESARPGAEWARSSGYATFPTIEQPPANTFKNVWVRSGYGTLAATGGHPWDTYIKPDLVAPATQIVGLKSAILPLQAAPISDTDGTYGTPEVNWNWINQLGLGQLVGGAYSQDYVIGSGTSFAAPVGSGAALIASRVFSSTPGAARPALIKAMLVATARSLRGGKQGLWSSGTPATIEAAPNVVQGFGAIDITDIVTGAVKKSYVNETTTFTTTGAMWAQTYSVYDTSKPVKIALAWTDTESIGSTTSMPSSLLVNDLDLEVQAGDGVACKQYYGNNIGVRSDSRGEESTLYTACEGGNADTKNTVEKVLIFPASTLDNVSRFTVVVRATKVDGRSSPCPTTTACTSPADQSFGLYVQNAEILTALPAPQLTAATGDTSSVTVSWQGVQGAAKYQLYRADGTGAYVVRGVPTASLSYVDSSLSSGIYRYKVRAMNADNAAVSLDSNVDYAYVGAFTDTLSSSSALHAKSIHTTELRTAVNLLRAATGVLSPAVYTYSANGNDRLHRENITELRTALNDARALFGLPAVSVSESLSSGHPRVKYIHLTEIRDALR